MSNSLEMRWFLPSGDSLLAQVSRLFQEAHAEPERVDEYALTGNPNLGIKARIQDGKPDSLEIKHLIGSLGLLEIGAGSRGLLERWDKISLEFMRSDLKTSLRGNPGIPWLALAKRRRIHKYRWENKRAEKVDVLARPEAGCNVELTEIGVEGRKQTAWTFGFEAFGPEPDLLEAFNGTTSRFFGKSALEFQPSWSSSYPKWIAENFREMSSRG